MTSVTEGVRQSNRDGTAWRFAFEFSLAAGVTKIFGFITAAYTVSLGARDLSSSGEDTLFLIYDDISYTGGTLLAMQSRNRKHKDATDLNPIIEMRQDVTATPVGAPMTGAHLLFANKGVISIGSDQDSAEILLKPSTSHILTVTNNDLQTATVGVAALFRRGEFIA